MHCSPGMEKKVQLKTQVRNEMTPVAHRTFFGHLVLATCFRDPEPEQAPGRDGPETRPCPWPTQTSAKNTGKGPHRLSSYCKGEWEPMQRELSCGPGGGRGRGLLTRQLRSRDVLPILVGQLAEAPQATAVAQHGVPGDSVI